VAQWSYRPTEHMVQISSTIEKWGSAGPSIPSPLKDGDNPPKW